MWDIERLITTSYNNKIIFNNQNHLRSLDVFNTTQILLADILYDYKHGEDYSNSFKLRECIKRQVLYLFEGNEPTFENSHIWAYSLLCQSISLLKKKDSLWELFTAEEQEKLTLIMKMFAFMWNFGCNVKNNFYTGISLKGNYASYWRSPNYWLCNQSLLLFLVPFFGGIQNINSFVTKTSYESLMRELKNHNFMNAYNAWNTPGFVRSNGEMAPGSKELFGVPGQDWHDETAIRKSPYIKKFEYGFENEYFAGKGIGATIPILYKENQDVDDNSYPYDLYHDIISVVFNAEDTCKSVIHIDSEEDFSAHITDGTLSPYEGQLGMMREFNKRDMNGQRSSLMHCEIDFILTTTMLSTLKLLVNLDYRHYANANYINTGINDFIYKKEHGYIGYCLGNVEYPDRRVKNMWLDWWKNKEV